jgi:hypothetical protein
VTLGLLVGPSMADDLIAFPFPTLHVQTPEDIEKVLAAVTPGG